MASDHHPFGLSTQGNVTWPIIASDTGDLRASEQASGHRNPSKRAVTAQTPGCNNLCPQGQKSFAIFPADSLKYHQFHQ